MMPSMKTKFTVRVAEKHPKIITEPPICFSVRPFDHLSLDLYKYVVILRVIFEPYAAIMEHY